MRTRFAPTPSGYLHAGNVRNLEIIQDVAREGGLDIALRIDDADADRYRREYVEDIFITLRGHGFEWQIGPRDVDDLESNWSQRAKTAYYRAALDDLRDSGASVYACECSRTQLGGPAVGGCVGACQGRALVYEPGRTALRISVDPDAVVSVSGVGVPLGRCLGDFVVWRRDDRPAYQLVSVIEDRDLAITHIVRGEDLLESSAAQIYLATRLGAPNVVEARYIHHELVRDDQGRKLSKSHPGPLNHRMGNDDAR